MSNPLLVLMNGITYGSLLFMGASGLTLIMGLMGIVNLAHGSYYLLGALVGYSAMTYLGLPWPLAIVAGGVALALLSLVVRKGLFRFVSARGMEMTLLTIGLSMVINDFVLWVTEAAPKLISVPDVVGRSYDLGVFEYPGTRLFILLAALIQGAVLWFIMQRTRIGMYIRAGADKREMAEALGVNINAVFTFVFIFSGFLVGMSGVLGGSYSVFTVGSTDSQVLSYSLVIIILGGLGSLKGAAFSAMLVGIVDSFSKALVPNLTPTIIFGMVILMLAFRPQGLFRRRT